MLTFEKIVDNIIDVADSLIVLIMGLALISFLYGLVTYLANTGSEDQRKESIWYMVAGIIGLFVMASIWGILYIIGNTFDIPIGVPQLN